MKAVVVSTPGGPEVLEVVERPKPVLKAGWTHEKCGRVNKWSLDRVLKAVQIQMGMEGEGHDGRGI